MIDLVSLYGKRGQLQRRINVGWWRNHTVTTKHLFFCLLGIKGGKRLKKYFLTLFCVASTIKKSFFGHEDGLWGNE
jgi:hypothetical protein